MNSPDGSENNTEDKNSAPGSAPKPAPSRKGLYIIVAVTIGLILLSRHEPVETIDCTPQIIATSPDIIMLGAWWCSYCYKAKKYFQQNNIHYCEYDMESTDMGKQLYQEHGGGAIPKLLIGDYQVSGFNRRHIERALEILHNNMPEAD